MEELVGMFLLFKLKLSEACFSISDPTFDVSGVCDKEELVDKFLNKRQ